MPIYFLSDVVLKGVDAIPSPLFPILKALPLVGLTWLLKWYFAGASNTSERLLHSKVVLVTVSHCARASLAERCNDTVQGGTSGIGAAVVHDLASRGAQIILLTHHPPSDPFLVDYIDDMRTSTGNELIYAEQVDLASLQSIRLFATKWVDNAPPRRVDMIVLCADTLNPRFGVTTKSQDGVDPVWAINYLSNFHLLSILSPALRAQPPDRDVRIIFTTCASYVGGNLKGITDDKDPLPLGRKYETSKLALMVFAQGFQKHLDNYQRPDKQSNNARVIVVDPGFSRTPGMRRWLTMGSLWGLLLYLILWPLWWLVLKSPIEGAQSILRAVMEAELGRGHGGRFLRECKVVEYLRKEINDQEAQQKLWTFSEKQIEALEKEGAVRRALAKKDKEKPKSEAVVAEELDKASEQQSKDRKPQGSRRGRKAG